MRSTVSSTLAASRWPEGFAARCAGQRPGCSPAATLGVLRLPSADLGDRRDGDARHRTPLRLWFWAAYLIATHTGDLGQAAAAPARARRYETAWLMLHQAAPGEVAPERGRGSAASSNSTRLRGGGEPRRRGGRDRVGKRLVAVAVEVLGGLGQAAARRPTRREQALARPDKDRARSNIAPGAIVRILTARAATRPSRELDFDHRPMGRSSWRNPCECAGDPPRPRSSTTQDQACRAPPMRPPATTSASLRSAGSSSATRLAKPKALSTLAARLVPLYETNHLSRDHRRHGA